MTQYPMYPDVGNALAILDGLASAMALITFPLLSGSPGNYIVNISTLKRVVVGGLKDYSDNVPLSVVRLLSGKSKRQAYGGKIRDIFTIIVRFAVDLTDATLAEMNIANIYNYFTRWFHQHATIDSTIGVFNSKLDDETIRFGYTNVQRIEYRVVEMNLDVSQEYAIQGGIIN